MADTRFKNATFDLSDENGRCASWDRAQLAALYDIRDELKRMNSILYCPNFLAIPQLLRDINKNTKKRKKIAARPKLRSVA